MLETFTIDTFQPHLGDLFQAAIDDVTSIDVCLVAVAPMREQKRPTFGQQAAQAPQRKPFAIVFRAPLDSPLPQRMYPLTHPRLGTLDQLFLVPIAEDGDGLYYEAVFN